MAEATDGGTEGKQEEKHEDTSADTSGRDLAADVRHFQSLADKRDAEAKTLREELNTLKAAQEAATKKELEEKEEFKKLYEGAEKKAAELESQATALTLRVKLQEHLAEKAPDYAPDFKWLHPHVTSEEDIASVVEDYMKAHPKTPGTGNASMGNRGAQDGQKTISKADLADPAKSAALLKEDPDLPAKIEKGEITLI